MLMAKVKYPSSFVLESNSSINCNLVSFCQTTIQNLISMYLLQSKHKLKLTLNRLYYKPPKKSLQQIVTGLPGYLFQFRDISPEV